MNKKAVILLSGGIDSSTTAAIARAKGYDLYALSFDYSQRHGIELGYAARVAESLGAKKHLVIKFDLGKIGGSALTSEIEVPKISQQSAVSSQRSIGKSNVQSQESKVQGQNVIPATYVPARNTIFLSFGLAWAETLRTPDIFIGANAVDYSGYPDCRPEYLEAFEKMANLATKISVEGKVRFRINAPLLHMTKSEIIKKGTESGLDYSLTWSCYDPEQKQSTVGRRQSGESKVQNPKSNIQSLYVPCGRCDSCLFRAKGFKEAGLRDPLLAR